MLSLRIWNSIEGDEEEAEILHVVKFPASIGRASHNPIRIEDETISSQHAVIQKKKSGYSIKDLSSRNGITVADKKVKEVKITHGLKVRLGNSILEFSLEQDFLERTKEIHLTAAKSPSFKDWGLKLRSIGMSLGAGLLVCLINLQIAFVEPHKFAATLFTDFIFLLTFALLVSAGISILSKIFSGNTHFLKIAGIVTILTSFALIDPMLMDTLLMETGLFEWKGPIEWTLWFLLITYSGLWMITTVFEKKKSKTVFVIVSTLIFMIFLSYQALDRENSPRFDYESVVGYPLLKGEDFEQTDEILAQSLDASVRALRENMADSLKEAPPQNP